jgi:hypothetical protein
MGGFCTKTCTDLVSLALFGPFYTSHSATVLPVGVASFFGAPEKVRRKRVVRSFGCDVSARRKECKKRARFGADGQLRQASTGLGQFQSTRHTPCAVLCRRHTDQAALGARCLLQFVQVIYARALGVKAAHGGLPGLRSARSAPARAAAGAVWLLSNCQRTNSARIYSIEGRAMGHWRDSRGLAILPQDVWPKRLT